MGTYFKNVKNLEELRKQNKELLKKHHPDNGGNVTIMQEVNVEYDRLFKSLKDRHENGTETAQTEYNQNMYDWENDKALREALEKIVSFEGIDIVICGQWIWVGGNTYYHKKELKETGFKWASQKKMWYSTPTRSARKAAKYYLWKI